MALSDVEQMQGLMGLLAGSEQAHDYSEPIVTEKPRLKLNVKTPGQIKAAASEEAAAQKAADQQIWNDQCFEQKKTVAALPAPLEDMDPRARPDVDIMFHQKVGAQDVFLNLGDVDARTDHCQGLTVKIRLPGERVADLDLDVQEERVSLVGKLHKLHLDLPLPVRKDEGKAQFQNGVLSVRLPIKRDVQYFSDVKNVFAD